MPLKNLVKEDAEWQSKKINLTKVLELNPKL